jgi:ABC-type lipoprotein export system ATPase subunit
VAVGAVASAPPVGCLRAVEKGYGDRPVLRGLDVDVLAGRLLVVRGRSGAGKSTLLRILLGLERSDAGTVHVDGVDLATLDRNGLADLRRRCVSMTGQDVHLAETVDIATNLELARAVRGLVDDPALLAATVESLRLTPLLGREVRLLSGGERQRASVARSLVVQPRLVVLDEPTSQLDEASAEGLVAVLVRVAAEGTAVVVASHDPVVVDAADAVLDLEGRALSGTRGR